jgi:hypothetical protein
VASRYEFGMVTTFVRSSLFTLWRCCLGKFCMAKTRRSLKVEKFGVVLAKLYSRIDGLGHLSALYMCAYSLLQDGLS